MKLLILIIFLTSSCNSVPTIINQVRVLHSIEFNACFCQWYNLNKFYNVDKFKRCEDFYSENFPTIPLKSNAEYCDDLVGFPARVWAKKITPHAHNVLQWGYDHF